MHPVYRRRKLNLTFFIGQFGLFVITVWAEGIIIDRMSYRFKNRLLRYFIQYRQFDLLRPKTMGS